MSKLYQGTNKENIEGKDTYLYFNCPACKEIHGIMYPKWSWNKNYDFPTFEPSIKCLGNKICHFFIRDGKFHYCDDCWHSLAGKTVDMVEWDQVWFGDE